MSFLDGLPIKPLVTLLVLLLLAGDPEVDGLLPIDPDDWMDCESLDPECSSSDESEESPLNGVLRI